MRVRYFTQDDAHIFMLPEQVKDEIIKVIDLVDYIYKQFGFNYHVGTLTRPENAMGSQEGLEIWLLMLLGKALEEKYGICNK